MHFRLKTKTKTKSKIAAKINTDAAWLCFKEKGETDVQLLQQQQAVLYDTTNLMWKGVASGETEVCGRHSPHTALATQDQTFGGLGRPYGKCR